MAERDERTISVELRDITTRTNRPSTIGTGTVSPLSGSPSPSEVRQARAMWEGRYSYPSTAPDVGSRWSPPVPVPAVPDVHVSQSNAGVRAPDLETDTNTNTHHGQSNKMWKKRQIAAVSTAAVIGFAAVGATAGLGAAYSECAKTNKELNANPPTVTETVTHTKTVIDGDICREANRVTPTATASSLGNRSHLSDWSTPTDTTFSSGKR